MRIAITGSTGLVGKLLVAHFKNQGHAVTRIVRSMKMADSDPDAILWDVPTEKIERDVMEGQDVVIHLAGANIAGQRWSPKYKRLILNSRVQSTDFLCRTLAGLERKPRVLLSASAVGYYGNHPPSEVMDENSPLGKGFLAEVCRDWEAATAPAEEAGIRVVHMRIGVVLHRLGGALGKMLPIFKLGLGGKLASGKQMMSWIALDEFPGMVTHLIENENISGAVNLVAPQPVSNAEFTKVLGEVIRRPVILPAPSFAIKLLLGEMGDVLLLEGVKVAPVRLSESGYKFSYPDLKSALKVSLR